MNREWLTDLMRQHDVGAVIGVTPPNVCYLTGHQGWAQYVYRSLPAVAAFTDDGSPGTDLVIPRSETPYHAAEPSGAERVEAYGGRAGLLTPDADFAPTAEEDRFEALQASCERHRTVADALIGMLSARDLRGRRVVIDDPDWVPGLVDQLASALGVEVVAGEGLFLMSRLVKTAEEIEALRTAGAINAQGLETAMAAVREGATEREISTIWRREIGGEGARALWFHLGSGARSSYVFPPGDRAFQTGDLFMLDAGLMHRGVLSDTGLCGSIGEPSERALKEYQACVDAFMAAESVIRAGVRGSQIFDALSDGLASGILSDVSVPFAGHTIGFEAREFPFILGPASTIDQPFLPDTSDIELPVGATINVEIPLGRMGYGGYQIERTYALRDGGFDLVLGSDTTMLVR